VRVFFDTNVLISAFMTSGVSRDVFERCLLAHEIYISEFVLRELRDVMMRLNFDRDDVDEIEKFLRGNCIVVVHGGLNERVCRDESDDNILAGALEGKVDVIVTGDKDLLEIGKYKGILIVSPGDIWRVEGF